MPRLCYQNFGRGCDSFSFCALFAEAWKLKQAPIKAVTGLTYLRLLSPAPKRKELESTPLKLAQSFSGEEIVYFHQRYQDKCRDCHLDEDEQYHL